jgi:hypothetical protein
MAIPFLRLIQNMTKEQPSKAMAARHHLALSGLSQTAFIRQWGEPDSQIPLKKLGRLPTRRSMYLVVGSDDEADYTVWIYKKMDRILFFTRKRLISHFKWSQFEEERRKISGDIQVALGRPPAITAITLALVA